MELNKHLTVQYKLFGKLLRIHVLSPAGGRLKEDVRKTIDQDICQQELDKLKNSFKSNRIIKEDDPENYKIDTYLNHFASILRETLLNDDYYLLPKIVAQLDLI